jgi:signal transduction histidine kinase
MLTIGALGNSLRELLIFMLSGAVLPISSPLTSLALLFCAGMLLAYTQPYALFASLQRSDLSGFAARFLLLPAFVLPLLTLLLSRAVPQPSPFGVGFGSLLLLTVNLGLIVWFAEVLHANELRRQQADQQRVVIDQHLMLITDQLPAILWTTDRNLRITAIHGSALMPFSRDPAAFLGQGIDHIMGSVQLERTSAAHHQALAGQSSSYEHDIGQRRFDMRTEPLRDHQGQIVGVIGLALDSTERREMEAAIFQLNTVLEQRVAERTNQLTAVNDELEAFSYSVSHDLRAPLRSMINYSQALEEDFAADLPPEAQAYLGRIRSSGERMNLLITDLLALAQVTRLPLHAAPVSLSALAHTIIAELQQADPARNATITVQPDLWVLGDLRLLEVALRNLLGNAWKFTAKRPHTQIRLFATQHDDEWHYHIGDNGTGFPSEQAQRLFEPFRRFHHERDFPGTGIGLATVKRVITRHGGRIWALSTPDQGATFSFSLPALPPSTAESLHSREEIYAPAAAPADD